MYPKPAYVTLLTITCAAVVHQAFSEIIKPLNALGPVLLANTSFVDNILKRYRRESPESSGGAGGGGSGGFPEVKPEWRMAWPNTRAMDDLKNAVILTLLDQVAREFEPALPQLVDSYIAENAPSGGASAGGSGLEEDENYSEGDEPMQGYPEEFGGANNYLDPHSYDDDQQGMYNPLMEPPQAQPLVQPAPAPIDDGNDGAEGSSSPTVVGTGLCRMITLVLVVRASCVISGRV